MKRVMQGAVALGLGMTLVLGGCARQGVDYVEAAEDIVDSFPFEAQPVEMNPQQAQESNLFAVFHTTAGDITVMLYPEESPEEVERFVQQVEAGSYDGQQFVYVRKNGLIECDNPSSDQQAQQSQQPEPTQSPAGGEDSAASQTPEESTQEDKEYTQEELDAVELPEYPQDVEGQYYSDQLHHYYGALGVTRENEEGGDRLHFVVETTKPEDQRLVPVNLYMRRLINLRSAQLSAMVAETPLSDLQMAAFESKLNEEIQTLGNGVIPEDYAQLYEPVNKMYGEVGGQWALDYQYPVIGQIVEGQNVADAISQAKVDAMTRKPKQEIKIEYVEIIEK